ncbi:CDPK-related kinase 5-like protein, partial [Tanacetum coccineum]
ALSKTLTSDDLFYLKKQFSHLGKSESVTFNSINTALMKHATSAMKESRITDYLSWLTALKLDFDEFCAAVVCVRQLETLDQWEQRARCAYEIFDKDGNREIIIEELASELGLGPSVSLHEVLTDWIRHTDGKLSYHGFFDQFSVSKQPSFCDETSMVLRIFLACAVNDGLPLHWTS